jgi:hypothetical protein
MLAATNGHIRNIKNNRKYEIIFTDDANETDPMINTVLLFHIPGYNENNYHLITQNQRTLMLLNTVIASGTWNVFKDRLHTW